MANKRNGITEEETKKVGKEEKEEKEVDIPVSNEEKRQKDLKVILKAVKDTNKREKTPDEKKSPQA